MTGTQSAGEHPPRGSPRGQAAGIVSEESRLEREESDVRVDRRRESSHFLSLLYAVELGGDHQQ